MTAPSAPPPTAAAVERLRALLAKATPGRWKLSVLDEGFTVFRIRMGSALKKPGECEVQHEIELDWSLNPEDGKQYEEAEANAALIAEGISALPGPLDQLDAQAKALEAAVPLLKAARREVLYGMSAGRVSRDEGERLKESLEQSSRAAQLSEAIQLAEDALRAALKTPEGDGSSTPTLAPSAPAAGGEAGATRALARKVKQLAEAAIAKARDNNGRGPTGPISAALALDAGLWAIVREVEGPASDKPALAALAPPASRTPPEAGAAPGPDWPAAFVKYGQHKSGCYSERAFERECDCGLYALKQQATATPPEAP